MTAPPKPSLALERRMMRAGSASVLGVDEVGRGSLAGPVTVGAVLVLPGTPTAPAGVRDSKELTSAQRQALAPRIRRWAPVHAVGHAWPEEIDTLGLTAALRLAAVRALRRLDLAPGMILLDGSHDWLADGAPGPVTTRIKADRDCSSVAAASVLAKVERDQLMTRLGGQYDGYGWCSNKGYAAPEHLAALACLGPTLLHRLSWQLPGVGLDALSVIDPERTRTWRRFAEGEQLIFLDGDREPGRVG